MRFKRALKLLTIATISLLSTSCMTTQYSATYDLKMTSVEHKKGSVKKVINIDYDKPTYSDSILDIKWTPGSKEFGLSLKNKSESTLKIIWDDAVFISPTGNTDRVMHTGVKFTDRNTSQPPTTIIRNSNMEDAINPSSSVYFKSGDKYTSPSWELQEMYSSANADSSIIRKDIENMKSKSILICLPIKVDDVLSEYIFVFKFKDGRINKNEVIDHNKSMLVSLLGGAAAGIALALLIL